MKKLRKSLWANTKAQMKKAGGGLGLLGLGPWGTAISIGLTLTTLVATEMAMASDISEINRKTLDPHKFTSMFADRTSELIKQGVATTIFGGNELLAAINTSTEEQASQMGQLLTFFLESTDRGSVPALGGP
jgi:hypothetical protein